MSRKGEHADSIDSSGSQSLVTQRRGGMHGNGVAANGSFGASTNGSRRAGSIESSASMKSSAVTEDVSEVEKHALLARKQAELDGIFRRHDDLVRESFHMHHFRMMLAYDPEEARKDNSQVLGDYKATFDLLNTAAPAAGPSRQTRRALTERKKIMTGVSTPVPPSPQINDRSTKRKIKPKTTELLSILSSARDKSQKKGKEKELEPDTPHTEVEQPFASERKEPAPAPVETPGESASIIARGRNGLKRQQTGDTLPTAPVEKKRQKLENKHDVSQNGNVLCPAQENVNEPLSSISTGRRSGRMKSLPIPPSTPKKPLPPVPLFVETPTTPQTVPGPSPETPKITIKRVKLIVRRPPPTLTNPRQRALPPKHGSSLTNLLSSYTTLNDKDIDRAAIGRLAVEEATIREREQQFKREGRFIPGTDALFGTIPDNTSYISPRRETKDSWDGVVEAITAQGRSKTKKVSGKQVAAQVASKVQAYWDAREAKKDKARAQEEKKLRMLAKSTIKQVVTEWKKAVFHIREQERLKAEAEERKRGHAHLDAILDQSGQLLETQQSELKRTDRYSSRSSSVSEHLFHWGSDQDEDENEDDDAEDVGGEDDDNDEAATNEAGMSAEEDAEPSEVAEDGEDVEMDVDSSMLLTDHMRRDSNAPSVSPSLTSGEFDQLNLRISVGPSSPAVGDDNTEKDNESIASLDHLTIPTPESSPMRLARRSPLGRNLTDYSLSESEYASSPGASPEDGDEGNNEPSTPQPITSVAQDISDVVDLDISNQSHDEQEPRHLSSPSPPLLNPAVKPHLQSNGDGIIVLDEEAPDLEYTDIQNESEPLADPNPSEAEDELQEVPEDPEEEPSGSPEPDDEDESLEDQIPEYLKPYAVAPIDYDPSQRITPPLLLRGVLRPYQQSGMEWLATLHINNLNGILADEMGLGKTIQTIALLAHLACDRGIWGPHLIVVPTSVLLNWEMEFKKFLPGFKILSYHGSSKRRKELRQGWMDKHHFNVCITSYTLASKDQHIFKRKPWYYMILDEAHMIKNFRSQRWNILLMFRSFRRLLLTGTPLQNNLTELWALLQFLMSGSNFVNLKEFGDWFSNPLEKAIEMGQTYDDETMQRVSKLHTVLRPYLLRRLKRDVEKELPSKFEHLLLCPLSKRQRFLYDEFMSRAHTRDALQSGVYQKIANILMQLRKVCNHPDLFEVRPIVTSFAMQRSAIADFEMQELFIRKRWLEGEEESVNLDVLGFRFIQRQNVSLHGALESQRLDATGQLPHFGALVGEPPPKDTRTIAGFRRYSEYLQRAKVIARWSHIGYLNRLRCSQSPLYGEECISVVQKLHRPLLPLSVVDTRFEHFSTVYRINAAVKSYADREQEMLGYVNRFAFVTPPVVALDMPHIAFAAQEEQLIRQPIEFDAILHRASTKLQIAFPDPSLLQYDCGKLQNLADLLREKKAGGHRILIFTQMTRILDILEIFLNFHGYLYLRLDGATKIEDRQYITERFNADPRIFCFISSSRSGGVGINLTGADTVVFYDSDFNPQMDRQCEDRAHRIGQIRDVHIYRFVSQHTVEEAMLRKANQKRSLDDLVIQKGEFDWRSLFNDESALTRALGDYEDAEDAHAAVVAAKEEFAMEGADEADFADTGEGGVGGSVPAAAEAADHTQTLENGVSAVPDTEMDVGGEPNEVDEAEEEGGTTVDYMLAFVQQDWEFFREWRL